MARACRDRYVWSFGEGVPVLMLGKGLVQSLKKPGACYRKALMGRRDEALKNRLNLRL